jgi:hypothetical protein
MTSVRTWHLVSNPDNQGIINCTFDATRMQEARIILALYARNLIPVPERTSMDMLSYTLFPYFSQTKNQNRVGINA